MKYDSFILLIPALDPDRKMLLLIKSLKKRGFSRFVITDDGSGPEAAKTFSKAQALGAIVVRHEARKGKGEALRTALKAADEKLGPADFYITADCDGQHTPEDIEKLAVKQLEVPDHFVIGVRHFEKTEGKKVSFWVNHYQRVFFRVTNHKKDCTDPRSGLRSFPEALKPLALSTEGKSYDYEMNFLDAVSNTVPVTEVPISADTATVDPTSHFRPVVDLLGMYMKFWRYLLTSNMAMVVDLILFALFEGLFAGAGSFAIFLATVCARAISGTVSYLLNRFISFRSRTSPGREMVRYWIVFLGQMAASGLIVSLLRVIPVLPTVLIKAMVDFVLFFVVYSLQKNWVFAEKKYIKLK